MSTRGADDTESRSFELAVEADTERLGEAVAARLQSQPDSISTIWLQGELGTGKTTLARAVLRSLGVTDRVRSPTFAIVERYDVETTAGPRTVCHVDLYRLNSVEEVDELGLADEVDTGALLIVEWPEQGASVLGAPDLHIHLRYDEKGRHGRVSGRSRSLQQWITSLSL